MRARRTPGINPVLPVLATLALSLVPAPGAAQAPHATAAEIGRQFEASARKLVALAEAMPAETWAWRPAEGVASVAEAYMHIARYNYAYPAESLGTPAPAGVDYDRLEGVVNDKEQGVRILAASMDHVRGVLATMSAERAEAATRLYGRDVPQWAVLLQLVTHMNEHLGQSIAYARMNGVVPPWSR